MGTWERAWEEFERMVTQPLPYELFCDQLRKFTPKEFVGLVFDLLRQMGVNDAKTGPVGANGAIDILLDGDCIVQCKKWKAKVGVAIVREVLGAAVDKKVKGAIIVAVSEFTSKAQNFAKKTSPPVGLVNGNKLFYLMNQHMPRVVADIQEGIWKSQAGGVKQ